jgi:hypothetical protein
MLIRHDHPIPPPHAINPPGQPPPLAFEVKGQTLLFILLPLQFHMQPPPRIHTLIRHPHVLHLFEIEQTFAISERV